MLGLGFGEILLLAGIALVVMGPEKFPDFAKMAIRMVKDVRGYWDEAQREFVKEVNPIKKEFKALQKYDAEEFIDHLAGTKKETPIDASLSEAGASGYGVKVPKDTGADMMNTPPREDDDLESNDPYSQNRPYEPNAGSPTESLDAVSEALDAIEEGDEDDEPRAPHKLD